MKKYIFRALLTLTLSLPAFGQFTGAVPDEIRRIDGSMASLVNGGTTGGTASTPVYTTNYGTSGSPEVALALFSWNNGSGSGWSSPPSTGTNILSVSPAANEFAAYVNYQSLTSPRSVSAVTGTYAGSGNVKWNADTLALIPTTGSTITIRTPTYVQQASGAGTTATVNAPSGEAAGDFLLVCAAWSTASGNRLQAPAGGVATILTNTLSTSDAMTCYAKMAGSSEPSTYTVTQTTTTQITAFMMAFANVLYPDELLTSPSATFGSGDVGKDICVATIPQSCGTIGAVVSGTSLVGWGVWNTSTTVSSTSTITSFTGTSGTLQFIGTNSFVAHQTVTLYGFTGVNAGLNGGWPTFTPFVKVGSVGPFVTVFDLARG